MLDKLKGMFEAQRKMKELQNGLESVNVDFESAAGKVKVRMSGTQKVLSLEIDRSILSAENKDLLEREIIACLNSASTKVQKLAAQELKSA